MDNFDLKNFLIENKLTRLSEEAMDAKSIVDKIKAGEIEDLKSMPADPKLAADIIKLLSNDKEALKIAKSALLEVNEETLTEGNLKNLVLGALMAVSSMAQGANMKMTSDVEKVLDKVGIELPAKTDKLKKGTQINIEDIKVPEILTKLGWDQKDKPLDFVDKKLPQLDKNLGLIVSEKDLDDISDYQKMINIFDFDTTYEIERVEDGDVFIKNTTTGDTVMSIDLNKLVK